MPPAEIRTSQPARGGPTARPAPLPSVISAAPSLLLRREPAAAEVPHRRRIWELDAHLHCSVIGTCLSSAELKGLLAKLDRDTAGLSDHGLHGLAVSLAGSHDKGGKLLTKALDKRHRLAVARFERAASVADLATLWLDARQQGEIPGAYWAVLTHPAATSELIRRVFGEVHMLSHLVGAANRADIRRLNKLEAEKEELEEKLRRQQAQLRDAILSRDGKIRELCALLGKDQERAAAPVEGEGRDDGALEGVIADLERRLAAETRRRGGLGERLEQALADLGAERAARIAAEARAEALATELAAFEAGLGADAPPGQRPMDVTLALQGKTLLYVGGRPKQVGHAKALSERAGAIFLHHDGGIEDSGALLAGLVSRADLALFPVDCISHEAARIVKRLCRQAAKPFLPLRSSGIGSFLAAFAGDEPAALPLAAGASEREAVSA